MVYPQLIENIKEILATKDADTDVAKSEVDILMPLAYPFPNLGTFMIFIFVPFAAWFTGHSLTLTDYPLFLSSTLLSSFVAPITGLPFSLDLMGISKDTFQLFVVSTVITDRIRVVLGAFHLITLTLLTLAATNGIMKIKVTKMASTIIISVIITAGSIIGLNKLLSFSMANIPTNREIVEGFELIPPVVHDTIIENPTRNPNWLRNSENLLGRIKRRGILRVGFYENAIPFTYRNESNKVVGLGANIAHLLANDLGVSLEFVPIKKGYLDEWLKKDFYDIVVSDIFLSSDYAQRMTLSKTYLEISLALLVKKDFNELNNYESAANVDTFTIAYFLRKDIAEDYMSYFPQAGLYDIPDHDSILTLSDSDTLHIDGLLTSAERAGAWTVYHPEYKVVNPLPYHLYNPLVFPLRNDDVWREYINRWIDYRVKDGSIDKYYRQWILGIKYREKNDSWSIYEDVLGWDKKVESVTKEYLPTFD